MKRFVSFCLLVTTLFLTVSVSFAVSPNFSYEIYIDGSLLTIPENMGIVFSDSKSRLQIPIRVLAEALDCDVGWDEIKREIAITKPKGEMIFMTVGSNRIETGKGVIEMDTVPVIQKGRTHIPVRFAAEALGYSVSYSAFGSVGRVDIRSIDEKGEPVFTPKYLHIINAMKDICLFPRNDDNFSPETPLTRVSCAKLLSIMSGNEEEILYKTASMRLEALHESSHPFTDVSDEDSKYVNFLYYFDILKGESSTRLGSDKPVTIEEFANMVLMLWDVCESPLEKPLEYMRVLNMIDDSEGSYLESRDTLRCDDAAGIYYIVFSYKRKTGRVNIRKINQIALEDMYNKFWTNDKVISASVIKPNTEGNSQENLRNGGNVAYQDNYTYFSNSGIWRLDNKTGITERISSLRAECINVIGDRIYFLKDTSTSPDFINYQWGRLYSIKTDGNDLRMVSDEYIKYFYIKDGWIYYINESDGIGKKWFSGEYVKAGYMWNYPAEMYFHGRIYRMRLDGTERTKLTDEGAFCFYIYNEQIYYYDGCSDGTYYKVNLDGSGKTLLEGQWFRVWDGYGYYYFTETESTGKKTVELRRHTNAGLHKTVLPTNESATSWEILFHTDKMYYMEYQSSNSRTIYVADLDGSNKRKLAEVDAIGFGMAGDHIYLRNTATSVCMRVKSDGTEKELFMGGKWVKTEN